MVSKEKIKKVKNGICSIFACRICNKSDLTRMHDRSDITEIHNKSDLNGIYNRFDLTEECDRFSFSRKRDKFGLKGNFTIEAAVIVPIIFILFLALIFISFYFRDIAYIKAVSYKTAYEYMNDQEEGEKALNEKLKSGLFSVRYTNSSVKASGDEIKVKVNCEYSVPIKLIREFLTKTLGKISVEVSASNLRGRDDLLRITGVGNIFK